MKGFKEWLLTLPIITLFVFTWLGGRIGTIAGMYAFRHKTQKRKFTIGMPLILIAETAFLIYMIII